MAEDSATATTPDKAAAGDDKVAPAGGAPVSDKKAADTAEAYEQLTGQADKPESDVDPIIAATGEDTPDDDAPTDDSDRPIVNRLYEEQRDEAFEARETVEDRGETQDEKNEQHDQEAAEQAGQDNPGKPGNKTGAKDPSAKPASSKSSSSSSKS